jgi:cell division protein FtsQ
MATRTATRVPSRTKVTRKPTRKSAPKRGTGKGKSWFPKMTFLERVPVTEKFIDRAITGMTVGVIGLAAVGFAWVSGLPGYVGTEMAQAAGRAGFAVKRVELTGLERMDRLTVYNIALDQHSMAMPLVDLEKVRSQLMRYGWVEDARVSRRLPDTLVVDIVERKPAAIWQNNKKLSLIDASGVVLERVNPDSMPALPILVGANANREAVALNSLIAQAPSLKPSITSASWVGNRRWDMQFKSGEILALPEGEEAAGKALTRFARIDGVERLLGRGFVRFDMRDPKKMVVRVAKKGAEKVEPASTGAIASAKKGETG